jgi:hypothetical protein
MRTLSNLELLELWERGCTLHPIDRALHALALALPDQPYDALADWPLGRRNTALAELRSACFGPKLEGWVACPECSERLEFKMDANAFNAALPPPQITVRGRSFRLPTSRDLARIAAESDPLDAAIQLAEQCCLTSPEAAHWSDHDLDEIGIQLAEADPMAETRISFECSECGHRWDQPLDIAAWLWTEIEARGRKLLFEVHTLASAYGWFESEILSLSEVRRGLYLQMVRA